MLERFPLLSMLAEVVLSELLLFSLQHGFVLVVKELVHAWDRLEY